MTKKETKKKNERNKKIKTKTKQKRNKKKHKKKEKLQIGRPVAAMGVCGASIPHRNGRQIGPICCVHISCTDMGLAHPVAIGFIVTVSCPFCRCVYSYHSSSIPTKLYITPTIQKFVTQNHTHKLLLQKTSILE